MTLVRRYRNLIVVVGLVTALVCVTTAKLQAQENAVTAATFSKEVTIPPLPKMIAGKPYSVSPGKDPGTYLVKWGETL